MTFSSVLFIFCTLLFRVYSQVIYANPSDECTTEGPMLGNSVYCCSGACLDGTRIGEPGQCENWLDLCGDVDSPPSCAYNQVLSYGDPATVDSGDGCCGACCCECQYQRNNWSWSCCDCPAGYIAVDVGTCGGTASPSCVGCQEPDQTLTGDPSTGFQCLSSNSSSTSSISSMTSTSGSSMTSDTSTDSGTSSPSPTPSTSQPPSQSSIPSDSITPSVTPSESAVPSSISVSSVASSASEAPSSSIPLSNTATATASGSSASPSSDICQQLSKASNRLNTISSISTWLGALCSTTDPLSATISLLEDAYAVAKAYKSPQTGFFGNSFGAASSVLATISAFTLGAVAIAFAPEEAAAASVIELNYEILCNLNTGIGAAVTLDGANVNDEAAANNCPPAITRRLALDSALHAGSRRNIYNPCAEFLSYFPTDYSIPASLDSVCDQIIADPSSQNTIPDVDRACQNYESSGNSTTLVNFVNMLQALQSFVPYCTENSTLISSNSSTIAPTTISSISSEVTSSKTSLQNFTMKIGSSESCSQTESTGSLLETKNTNTFSDFQSTNYLSQTTITNSPYNIGPTQLSSNAKASSLLTASGAGFTTSNPSLFSGPEVTEIISASTETTYTHDEGTFSALTSRSAETAARSTAARSEISTVPAILTDSGTSNIPMVISQSTTPNLSGTTSAAASDAIAVESGTGGTMTGGSGITITPTAPDSSPLGSSTATMDVITASAVETMRPGAIFRIVISFVLVGLLGGALWL